MKKKVFATLLAVSMIASMVPAAVSVQAADGDSIRLVNGKIEVDAQLKKLAEMYEKETGTKVEIESMGGGIDIQGTLKGYYQSDNMPDIFVNGGATDFANWTDLLVDMSDQEWASDTDAAYVDEKQGTIGFPYTTEAIGLAYNKDMQEDKEGLFDAIDTVKMCVPVFTSMIATMTVKKDAMLNAAKGGFTNATDAADWLVKQGVPFRDAHAIIGKLVLYCIEHNTNLDDLSLAEYKAISPVFDESVYSAINVNECAQARKVIGGPAKEVTTAAIAANKEYFKTI